jgi:hypothetical protein
LAYGKESIEKFEITTFNWTSFFLFKELHLSIWDVKTKRVLEMLEKNNLELIKNKLLYVYQKFLMEFYVNSFENTILIKYHINEIK